MCGQARRFFAELSDILAPGAQFIATTVDARVMVEHLMGSGVKQSDGKVIVELDDCSGTCGLPLRSVEWVSPVVFS